MSASCSRCVRRDALLDLRHAPLHPGAREVLVAVVNRHELAAVNRDVGLRQAGPSRGNAVHDKMSHKLCAWSHCPCGSRQSQNLLDRVQADPTATSPQRCSQPRTQTRRTRLNSIEIAVDVKASAGSRDDTRVGRLPRDRPPPNPKLGQTVGVPSSEDIDHARDRIVLAGDPVLQAFRETAWSDRDRSPQRKRLIRSSRKSHGNLIAEESKQAMHVFTQAGSKAAVSTRVGCVRFAPVRDQVGAGTERR